MSVQTVVGHLSQILIDAFGELRRQRWAQRFAEPFLKLCRSDEDQLLEVRQRLVCAEISDDCPDEIGLDLVARVDSRLYRMSRDGGAFTDASRAVAWCSARAAGVIGTRRRQPARRSASC